MQTKHVINTVMVCQILNGELPMPPLYEVGKDCRHHHGQRGKTVVYKATGRCIVCNHNNCVTGSSKKLAADSGNRTSALHVFEDMQKDDDYWGEE